jgi:hypothetical protein
MKDFNHRIEELSGLTGIEFVKAVVVYTIIGITLAVAFNGGI